MKNKKSFFERLTGSVNAGSREIPVEGDAPSLGEEKSDDWMEGDDEGQLTVDVYQTPDEIVVQTIVAGVKPENLDVDITREMITIRGKREQSQVITDEDYFYQELYWGGFSRSILLPQEVDTEGAEARLKDGLLSVHLPKLDKHRASKLKIKKDA